MTTAGERLMPKPHSYDSAMTELCDACRGEGVVMVSEWNDQYDRTHASYDTCPGCGGEGEIDVEPIEDCPEAIAQWATLGEREDNWFQQNHASDEAFALRNSGQRERE